MKKIQEKFIFSFTFSLLLVLLVLPGIVNAQAAQATGKVAYPGSISVTDIMVDQMDKAYAHDPLAKISFKVKVPLIKDNKILVNDISGLPVQKSTRPQEKTSAIIEVPFSANEFRQGTQIDTTAFIASVDQTLSRLKAPAEMTAKNKGEKTSTQGIENDSNCSGFGIGTTLTVTIVSCLGTTINEYSCMSNQVNGGRDWFITSSTYLAPPSDTACIGY